MAGLALNALKLSHFRSHKRAELAFDGRPVAFVGSNGAGKTNLIEAISLLSPGRGLRRAVTEDLARRPESVGWKVQASLTRLHESHEVETAAAPGESRTVRIDDKPAPQVALAAIMPIVWLVPAMDRLWIEAAEGRRRFLDRMVMSFAPDHAALALEYEKAMRQRNRLLKDGVRDAHWYAAIERIMAKSGAEMTRNRLALIERLRDAQASADTAFPAADLTLTSEGPSPVDEAALADALEGSRPRDLLAGRSLVGPHRADLSAIWQAKGMIAADCSTGEQKALLISLVLANGRALAEDRGVAPILLLDEVSAHLDAARRAALYDEITAMAGQTFMTGTEVQLFAGLGPRAQGFAVEEGPAGSTITAVDLPG
ncbi:DNA replication/repair protein RecF [Ketogulonicigenium vulgare]|uniref:DNA replication and repair protein RecF n=1 Tax=Ketogulonicigenium vulgare (strain WSH-001) TaxID=759362 RepID=F9Y4E1_KETVW|nr:DNA replication/repair protein RecF [Ketogulonicigenium vulgare]ADO43473.1 recombination protein F [Ketogulonicigenium vulgare Y25]AEM41754.1 DNA replication and repair protein recF [Ketogulonicigenium vulgare WSH-001]ALJ81861.1 recombinase RecF [Ketogulonicigenium vulgare]ANW34512.1 DNA replication/repair protein RecF [Ketogulonicigenium vulgare]AOZ55509.1 recombination protein F [Ketogulonicigenium vulgare]